MEVLFVCAESEPYIKRGGLGDVAYALPKALNKKNIKVSVVLPYYKSIKEKNVAEFVCDFSVSLSWRKIYCGVFKTTNEVTDYYFIDNEYYFARDNVYGDYDDGERFAFFSKAVLEMLPHINLTPDIIHANDWQCALVPLFLEGFYKQLDFYVQIKTMFTIHNIEYQGKVPESFLKEVLGMDDYFMQYLYHDGCINMMKGAILLSNKVTTVSETYAQELTYDYFGHGLSGILNDVSYKLCGITNGIDMDKFNPETDENLEFNFSAQDSGGKRLLKKRFQRDAALVEDDDIAIMAVVSRLVPHKGMDLIKCVADDILSRCVQLVVIGVGNSEYEHMFLDLKKRYPEKVYADILFDTSFASRVYAASDLFLMPSQTEPCGLSQMIAMRYGSLPIVRETGGLFDTVKPIEKSGAKGRGITFKMYNAHDMLYAIDRGLSLYYKDKNTFQNIVKNNMQADFSWDEPADKYIEVYKSMIIRKDF